MSVINTNYLSLVAQNNLQKSQSALGTAIERLSSGLRINSAKDDAAGQAIANRMGAQINGLNQAARNANDGISAAQTTEGALNQINDNLQRIRVLTVQATNGTNSDDDLTSIQNEIGQRLEEINRISRETEFNGVQVLAKDETLKIQVGANDGQVIEIDLQQIDVSKLGLSGFNVNGAPTNNAKATVTDVQAQAGASVTTAGASDDWDYNLTVDNEKLTASSVFANLNDGKVAYTGTNNAYGVAADSNEYAYDSKTDSFTYTITGAAGNDGNAAAVTSAIVPSSGTVTATYEVTAGNSIDVVIDSAGTITTTDGKALFITEDGNLSQNDAGTTLDATVDNLMEAFDNKTGLATFVDGAKLTMTSGNIEGTSFVSTAAASGVTIENARISAADLVAASKASGTAITATLSDSTAVSILANGNVQNGGNDLYIQGNSTTGFAAVTDESYEEKLYVADDGSISNADDGNGKTLYVTADGELTFETKSAGGRTETPLDVLDTALAQVDALRSDLGAIQNRFESAITNLQTTSNNLAAAQSRIQDADYSVEVANMTRAQILQQAGTSVLAQANQIPQGVLSLLR